MKTTMIVPDLQMPYHDPLALKKLIQVIKDVQPDAILQVGDGIDFPTVSRWSVGTAAQYSPVLQEHIDSYCNDFLIPTREAAPNANIKWLSGNHDERLWDFIKKYAAPLSTLRALSIESLFGLDELRIKFVKGPERIGTNVYAIHGHESGGYSGTLSAWDSKFTKRYGSDKSYVFGHTHQGGIITRAYGWSGRPTPRFTMNVGSIMNPEDAKYVKDGSVSWQMSFGFMYDDGKRVYPELVSMVDRGFMFQGRKY